METKIASTLCSKGCCIIHIKPYTEIEIRRRRYPSKAGAFLYDPAEDRVLLVQSRGQLWGPPKGTVEIEKNETQLDCAIREVKEETGLSIENEDLTSMVYVNRALYYYIEKKSDPVFIQEGMADNDATGITWIKVSCLQDCLETGKLEVNYHCKQLFRKLLHIRLPTSEKFTTVYRQ